MSEQLAISVLITEADDYACDDPYLSNLLSRLARAVESMSAAIVAKNLELNDLRRQRDSARFDAEYGKAGEHHNPHDVA